MREERTGFMFRVNQMEKYGHMLRRRATRLSLKRNNRKKTAGGESELRGCVVLRHEQTHSCLRTT